MIKFIKGLIERRKRNVVFKRFKVLSDFASRGLVSRKTYDEEVDKVLRMFGFDPEEEKRLIAEEWEVSCKRTGFTK